MLIVGSPLEAKNRQFSRNKENSVTYDTMRYDYRAYMNTQENLKILYRQIWNLEDHLKVIISGMKIIEITGVYTIS